MALQFLEMCGYKCLGKQYRKQSGEIDLIVRRGDEVVFVEVKTRGPGSLAAPEAWINEVKISRIRETARYWIFENSMKGTRDFRFDVVAVEFFGNNKGMNIKHYAAIM